MLECCNRDFMGGFINKKAPNKLGANIIAERNGYLAAGDGMATAAEEQLKKLLIVYTVRLMLSRSLGEANKISPNNNKLGD